MVIQSESQPSTDHQRIKITPGVLGSCCWQSIVILNQFWAQHSLLSVDWCLCQSRVLLTTAILLFSPLGTHGQNIGNAQITKQQREKFKKWIKLWLLSEPPPVPPEITGVPLELRSGEWLKVQCHLPWMNVKPQLEFFVNGKKAKHMVSSEWRPGLNNLTRYFPEWCSGSENSERER